jgi:predicted N-acetyltransferase YhbS
MNYRVEALGGQDRAAFSSGSDVLDRYFRFQVSQDVRRRVASCFVALDEADLVAGYYTIATAAVALDALPLARAKKLPRYASVPAVLLGRLAVATAHQGERLGAALVADALMRARRMEIAAYALVVDAKNDAAARFYEHLGFERFGDARRLFHPLGNIG